MLAARVYWHLFALQMPEQQSEAVRQDIPVCPQQLQVCPGTGPDKSHRAVVPSDLRHWKGWQLPV